MLVSRNFLYGPADEHPFALSLIPPAAAVAAADHRVRARYCSRCLVKSQGGCSFGLFNYYSYVSFWAISLIWGI